MITDIIAALFAAAAWTGTLVLLFLLARQRQGFPILRKYIKWKFIAWTLLILFQTLSYINYDTEAFAQWAPRGTFPAARMLSFRFFMAFATWGLIRDLLAPRWIPAAPRPEAQVQINANDIIVGWNAQATALFGWTTEEVLGKELADVIIPDSMRDAHRAGMAHYRHTGEAPLLDTRYTQQALHKDGLPFFVDISLTAHLTTQGTIFLGTCSPVTERR